MLMLCEFPVSFGTLLGHSRRRAWKSLQNLRQAMAAIRHVHHIGAGHHLEQLAVDMRRAADAGRRHIDFAGIGLGVGNELGKRFGRNEGFTTMI